MEISINNIKDYSKKESTIIIKDKGISLIDGKSCYEKVLSKDVEFIGKVENKLAKIMFSWKEEYVGNRKIDGEKYYIVVDVNHKKKKYKIQNKFPDNWDEFLQLQSLIMEGKEDA
jgi:hypothetical protein